MRASAKRRTGRQSMRPESRASLSLLLALVLLPAAGRAEVRVSDAADDEKTVLEMPPQRLIFNRQDNARICGWRFGNKDYVLDRGQGHGLAGDALWSPRTLGRKVAPYEYLGHREAAQAVTITFKGFISTFPLQVESPIEGGWAIIKTYTIAKDRPSCTVQYEITNTARTPRYFSFWFHNWLALGAQARLMIPGLKGVIDVSLSGLSPGSNLVFPVSNAPFTRGNESFEKQFRRETLQEGGMVLYSEAARTALVVRVESGQLLQEYTNVGLYPTLELMMMPCTMGPGAAWRMQVDLAFHDPLTRAEAIQLTAAQAQKSQP